MLANLFLPKEIRDIIAELRSKDDLNKHALFSLYGHFYLYIFLWICSSTLIYLLSFEIKTTLFFISISALIICAICFYDINSHIMRMMVYFNGHLKQGSVLSVSTHYGSSALTAHVMIKDDHTDKTIKLGTFTGWHKTKSFPAKNSKIIFFSNGDLPAQNMPCDKFIMKKYCLSLQQQKEFDKI